MKKYYSSLDKNFKSVAFGLVVLSMLFLPAYMYVNKVYLFESTAATVGFCILVDLAVAGLLLNISKAFHYMPKREERTLQIKFGKKIEDVNMADVKKVEKCDSFVGIHRLGYGTEGIVLVFKNGESLGISPKKKESEEIFAVLRQMMGGKNA